MSSMTTKTNKQQEPIVKKAVVAFLLSAVMCFYGVPMAAIGEAAGEFAGKNMIEEKAPVEESITLDAGESSGTLFTSLHGPSDYIWAAEDSSVAKADVLENGELSVDGKSYGMTYKFSIVGSIAGGKTTVTLVNKETSAVLATYIVTVNPKKEAPVAEETAASTAAKRVAPKPESEKTASPEAAADETAEPNNAQQPSAEPASDEIAEPDSFVTLNPGEGAFNEGVSEKLEGVAGATATLPAANQVTRADYTLIGWSKKVDATEADYQAGATYELTKGETTLFAVWKHTGAVKVVLDANSGTFTSGSKTIEADYRAGDVVTLPTFSDISYKDHGLIGWSTDKNATTAMYAPHEAYTVQEEATTLYAVWGKGKTFTLEPTLQNVSCYYVVTDKDGNIIQEGSANQKVSLVFPENGQYYYTNVYALPADNYLVTGLNADREGKCYDISETPGSGNPARYANHSKLESLKAQGYVATFGWSRSSSWTQGWAATRLAFEIRGEHPIPSAEITSDKTEDVKEGDKLTLTVNVKPGDIAKAAETRLGADAITVNIAGDTYEVKNATKNSDGTYTGTIEYVVTADDALQQTLTATTTGDLVYTYKLYKENVVTTVAEVETTSEPVIINLAKRDGKVTYGYAYYNTPGAQSTFPEAIKGAPVDAKQYYNGDTIAVAATPASTVDDPDNEGTWTFDGWYLNRKKVSGGSKAKMVEGGLAYIGKWTFTSYPTLTLNYNYPNSPEADSSKYKSGSDVSLATAARAGYTFTGWNTQANGSGTTYTNALTMPNSNLTLYAQWTANADQLEYDANGGTGSVHPTAGKTFEQVTVADNGFTRDGYYFTGWNTKADGTGTGYAAGDQYTLTAGTDTLYAQWTEQTKVTVSITGNSNTTTFDGKEHSVADYVVTSISDENYTVNDFTFAGEAKAARADAGTTNMGLAAGKFTNNNEKYNVTFDVTDGYQTINPLDVTVTVTGHTDEAKYDGTEHSVSGYETTISTPLYTAGDFAFNGEAVAKRTDVGTTTMGLAANKFANVNTTGNFGTVTFNVTDGYQRIVPADEVVVTITGKNNTTDYNGIEHSVSGYTVSTSNPLCTEFDFTFTGEAKAARTDAGTTNMGLTAGQFANKNSNFENVTFKVTDGYQTVTPIDATVTITGKTSAVDYDGVEHGVSGYDVETSTSLYAAEDFTFNGTASAARTNAGTTNMGLTAAQFVNNSSNFKTVTFNVTDGYQTINKINATVTITGHNSTADYSGTEHSVTGYEFASDTALYTTDDFAFSGKAEAVRTDAGTTNMNLAASQFTNTNENFETVTFNVTDGYQTVNPIDVTVTVTGKNNTTDYDGTEHSISGYDVAFSNPLYTAADFTFSGTAEAKQTNAGTANMGLAASQFANNNSNFRNVTFNVTDGYQTVNPIDATVTVVGANNTTSFDGEEHSVSGYTATTSTPLYTESDFTFTGKAEASRTNVGTTNMELTAGQFANTNTNFKSVTFNVTDGYQAIVPADEVVVTITGHNNTTNYDGTEHSISGYDVAFSNPLYTAADFTFSGTAEAKQTDAGTAEMGLTATQFANTNPNFSKVTFKVVDGYQTVAPIDATVTIAGKNNVVDYDGTEHSVEGYAVEFSSSLYTEGDFTFAGTAAAARTNAGTTDMGLSESQFANTNSNFANVTFNVTDGYQIINKVNANVSVTGRNATVDYDGVEHAANGYDFTVDNTLYTAADFTFTGDAVAARTNAGTTNMNLNAGQFANTNDNFATVTFSIAADGYQTVNPIDATVTVTGHNNVASYDGAEHSVSGYDAATSTALYTESDFTFSGAAEAARTEAGTTNMGLAADQFTNTNSNFKTVTFNVTDGYQTINPIDVTITITGNTNTVVYDGTDHSVAGYEVAISNPLYTEADFSFSGVASASRTDVGTSNMGLAVEQFANTNDNFANVTFTVSDGSQTVTPAAATVTAGTFEKVAGEADPEGTLVATIDGILTRDVPEDADQGLQYTVSREAGEEPGVYAITIAGPESWSNYQITYVPGSLTITAAPEPQPTPVTPDTPATPTTPTTPTADGTTPAATNAVTYIVATDTPTAAAGGEDLVTVDENGTPVAPAQHNPLTCWVHWAMFIGILLMALYFGGVTFRRQRNIGKLRKLAM